MFYKRYTERFRKVIQIKLFIMGVATYARPPVSVKSNQYCLIIKIQLLFIILHFNRQRIPITIVYFSKIYINRSIKLM